MNFVKDRYHYHFPCPIRFGAGVIDELGPHLKSRGLLRPLVVTDPALKNLSLFTGIIEQLEKSSLSPDIFSNIDKNPVASNVLNGVATYLNSTCDCIIGLGGGASMDVARAIALKAHHQRPLFDFDDALGGDQFVTEKIPYFVTVPTTSGTGSEVARSAVISEDEGHKKRILFSPRLMAKQVFADPALTLDLPAPITAAVGMDALTHNIEAYFAKGFSPLCDGIAIEAISLIHQSLKAATFDSGIENRSKMMMAALMGGTSFQKGLGIVHSMAHPLSTLFDTHHGLANAVMLPYGVRFNGEVVADKIHFLCGLLNLKEKSVDSFVHYLTELNLELKMPANLKELALDSEKTGELSDLALKDVCHLSNPKKVRLEDFQSLYKKSFAGKKA